MQLLAAGNAGTNRNMKLFGKVDFSKHDVRYLKALQE